MAMTAAVKDELAGSRSRSRAAARPRCPRCCGSPAACTSWPAASSSRPSSTPARPRGGCARTSPRSSATAATSPSWRRRGIRKGNRYVVRVVKDGEALARQTGLLDGRGRPVRGLPPAGRLRGGVRRRGRLARRVPGPRLADRARPLVGAGDHLPRPRGRAGPGRRRPPAGHRGQGPRGARRRPGGGPRRRRDRRAADPARRPRVACWPGRSAGCAARCGPPPTGWPTSTTPTCAARPGRRWPPAPGSSGRWRSSATTCPTTWPTAGRLRIEHRQASLEELGALADPPMTKDAIAGRIRRLLAMADKRAEELGHPRHRGRR